MSGVRTKRLRKTVQFLVDNPRNWDQSTWSKAIYQRKVESAQDAVCATQGCLAGWALMRSPRYQTIVQVSGTHPVGVQIRRPDGTVVESIANEAARYLGLTQAQADAVFAGASLTLEQFLAKISRITGVDVTDIKPKHKPIQPNFEVKALGL